MTRFQEDALLLTLKAKASQNMRFTQLYKKEYQREMF